MNLTGKKILLVGRASLRLGGKATGGISKHIEDLSAKLVENNFEVTIWDFRLKKSFTNYDIRIEGLKYVDILIGILYSTFICNIFFNKEYNHLSLKDKFLISIQSWKIQNYISSNNIQTIHVHSLNRPITHYLKFRFPDIKLIITDHGFWQKKGLVSNDENATFKKIKMNIDSATTVVTISSYAKTQFENYGLSTYKNHKIPNPIFLSKIPIKELKRENAIFFNGYNRSMEIKNFKLVIDALNFSPFFKNFKLIAIVNNEAKKYIKSINVNFEIEILDAQPWEVLVDLYNKSKILVVPSKSESFGLVYLESLAVGTPIIGFHETVKEFQKEIDLDIGEAFDPETEDYKDLSDKIEKVLKKQYDSIKLRNAVGVKYSWEKSIENFINLY